MNVIDGSSQIVPEPDWESVLNDPLELDAAREHWRVISNEMREAQTLTPANGDAMRALVIARVLAERMRRHVIENGPVVKPKRGNPKAIARVSPYHQALGDYQRDVVMLEDKLGISPVARKKAGIVDRAKKAPRAADRFLNRG